MQRVLAIDGAITRSADAWIERVDAAAAAGLEAIEVPSGIGADQISQAGRRGLRPAVVRWPGGLLEPSAGSRDGFPQPDVADLLSALEWTAGAGGSTVTVRPAATAPDNDQVPVPSYADALWATHNALMALCRPTTRTGVFVGVEPATDRFLLSPVELRDLLDRVNSPHIAACLNLANVARIGHPLDWIRTLRHRIVCVRLGDEEDAQLDETAAALREVLYTGPVVCSGDPADAAQRLSRFPLSAAL